MKSNMIIFMTGMTLILLVIISVLAHLTVQKRRLERNGSEMGLSRNAADCFGLSKREKEIAISILAGKTNHQIAQEKYIAVTTVKKHVYNLFNKTRVRNRIELANRLRSQI